MVVLQPSLTKIIPYSFLKSQKLHNTMPLKVQIKNVQRGPFKKLSCKIIKKFANFENHDYEVPKDVVIEQITFDDMCEVRLQFEQHLPPQFNPEHETAVPIFLFISAKKHPSFKDCTNQLNVTCEELNYCDQLTCTDKWLQNIDMGAIKCEFRGGYLFMSNDLDINFSLKKVETVTFARLYDDSTLTDFRLSTAEGSVAVHKVCLAAHSDVFKTMFSGPWKGTEDGRVAEIQGVTLNSLQHLKDYVYLGTLPEVGLHPLLLLASYYFMETLKIECIEKLVKSVQSENLYSLLEFACENNIPELTFAILLQTPDVVVDGTYQIMKEKEMSKQVDEE